MEREKVHLHFLSIHRYTPWNNYSPWNWAFPKGKDRLPINNFQGLLRDYVNFRLGQNIIWKSTPPKTNMTMENLPWMKMYFRLKIEAFPASHLSERRGVKCKQKASQFSDITRVGSSDFFSPRTIDSAVRCNATGQKEAIVLVNPRAVRPVPSATKGGMKRRNCWYSQTDVGILFWSETLIETKTILN